MVEPAPEPAGAPDELWFRVAEDTVGRQVSIGVRSEWVPAGAIASPGTGVLTEHVVPDGALVGDGDVIGTVDLGPIVVAIGAIPSFRALGLDGAGRDVAQLQDFLRRQGYLRGAPATFDAATEAAVRRWERDLGVEETGTVPVGRIVYVPTLPAPIRWTAQVGEATAVGAPMADVLVPEPTFTALLSPDQASDLGPGTAVAITSPGGHRWAATLGSNVGQGEAVEIDLTAAAGSTSICAAEPPGCAELPVTGQTRMRGDVTLVPPTTGPVVPVSAIRSDEQQATYVVVRDRGRTPVEVLATAGGMSVVEGVAVGAEVAIPTDPDGDGDGG